MFSHLFLKNGHEDVKISFDSLFFLYSYLNSLSFLFYRILLLLLGDISFNPGPKNNLQPLHSNKWNAFKSNIKSLFPKIDELRYMANYSNAAVIGISESKT